MLKWLPPQKPKPKPNNMPEFPTPEECASMPGGHQWMIWENRAASAGELEWWCRRCRVHEIEKLDVGDYKFPQKKKKRK